MIVRQAGRTRVLVVDDSVLVRKTVCKLIAEDSGLEVVGTAANGQEALDQVASLRPDVVSLDLNMPVMDGMTCLGHLVREYRQRVVILSTLAHENSFNTFKALALGAVDFVTKPGVGAYLQNLAELGTELRAKIHLAAAVPESKIRSRRPGRPLNPVPPQPKPLPGSLAPVVPIGARLRAVVGVGGSTGGTVSLETLLQQIPAFLPVSLVIVQHIAGGFSRYFARYLDSVSKFTVKEAEDHEVVRPHCAYLAPGGVHLRVQRSAQGLILRTDSMVAPRGGYQPSINTLFYSLATAERHRALGILLSGIGEDGVKGLEAIHKLGGLTMVQDRESSVVFDMAARAIAAGAVDQVLPPDALAGAVYGALKTSDPRRRIVGGMLASGTVGACPG